MNCENCEESAYVIDKLAKLLAEIAVIVNGTEPHDTLWSYHDLPEKVRALKQAPPAAAVPEGYALVPVEPTPEMIAAGWFGGEMHVALGHANAYRECEGDYARLLAAAQEKENSRE